MSFIPLSGVGSGLTLAPALMSHEPNYLVLFVTAVCNARCPMCFYWEEIESANAKLELRLEEYEKIAANLNHLYYLSIGGGEPFTRKDLPLIAEAFYRDSQTRIVTVATNGTYTDRVQHYIEYLTEHCPGLQLRIQVSIDNLFEKHDLNRGLSGLFGKLIETCHVIGQLKAAGRRVMLSIGVVLTPYNRDDLRDLRRYLDENIPYDDVSLIFPRGNAKDHSMKEVTWTEYREAREVFDVARAMPSTFTRLYQAIDRQSKEGIGSYLEEGPAGYPWKCVAGKKMITLTERGLLTPCEMLYQLYPDLDSSLGNVRDHNYDVLAMLAGDKAKKLREFIEGTHCSCSYECAAACNVVFHKKEWPSLLTKVLLPWRSRR